MSWVEENRKINNRWGRGGQLLGTPEYTNIITALRFFFFGTNLFEKTCIHVRKNMLPEVL